MMSADSTTNLPKAATSLLKRATDIVVSAAGLVVLSPFLGLIALGILFSSGTPVLFRQPRPGLLGRSFTILKFRTMSDATADDGSDSSDVGRVTRVGRLLRSTSLDELPELWNVLVGEMSLVGPRPLLMEYLPLYSERQARRHTVRPGITGWAQVNGRNALSWEEKFELDLWYVENWSYWLDWRILFSTVRQVVAREGVDASPDVTMERFRGSPQPPEEGE